MCSCILSLGRERHATLIKPRAGSVCLHELQARELCFLKYSYSRCRLWPTSPPPPPHSTQLRRFLTATQRWGTSSGQRSPVGRKVKRGASLYDTSWVIFSTTPAFQCAPRQLTGGCVSPPPHASYRSLFNIKLHSRLLVKKSWCFSWRILPF